MLSRWSNGTALMGELRNRSVTVGRWLAVRNVALADDDLLGAGDKGRDYEVIEIEAQPENEATAHWRQSLLLARS